MKIKATVLMIITFFAFGILNAQNENDFYTEPNNVGVQKNLVIDYGANGQDNLDDSAILQNAINDISSNRNGGRLIIPEGVFYFSDILLKSNVHIEIDSNTTIIPPPRSDSKNYKIFNLGSKNNLVQNVSIRGNGGRFTVDIRNVSNVNVGVFSCSNVENFMISDFLVLDSLTKFSALNFGIELLDGKYNSPQNGIVKNGRVENAHYGYGLIQTQAARNMLFKNLSGTGGVTLRWETGYDKMNELQVGGVFNMVARNISCENGNAAVMISPHAIQNGHVEVDTVYAKNCGFAVRIGNGYVKASQENLGLKPGTFASTSWVKNVTAVYGSSAQLKSKHFKYMPCNLRDSVKLLPEDAHSSVPIYSGPAIGAVLNQAEGEGPGKYQIKIENVNAIGFKYQPHAILTTNDESDCSGTPTNLNFEKSSGQIRIYPNPFYEQIKVDLPENHNFKSMCFINASGETLFQQKIIPFQNHLNINTAGSSAFSFGTCFIRFIGEKNVVSKKLLSYQ